MYEPLLFIHSWIRWVVLLGAIFFFIRSIKGVVKKETWGESENHFIWAYNQIFGYQVLFGLTLWLGLSPITKAAFKDFSLIQDNFMVLFYFALHGFSMIMALGVFHMIKAKERRQSDSQKKFKLYVVGFGIILTIFFFAIPWPWYNFGRAFFRWLSWT